MIQSIDEQSVSHEGFLQSFPCLANRLFSVRDSVDEVFVI